MIDNLRDVLIARIYIINRKEISYSKEPHHIMLNEPGGTCGPGPWFRCWDEGTPRCGCSEWCAWCSPIELIPMLMALIWCRCDRCSDGSSFGLVSTSRLDMDWAPLCCEWATTSDWPFSDTGPFSAFFFCLRSLARRFWNQILTCRSDSCNDWASSDFRRMVMYRV